MKANILFDYENKWVALDKNRTKVLHAAQSMDSLLKKLSEKEKGGLFCILSRRLTLIFPLD